MPDPIPHDVLMSMKVSILEATVIELLMERFLRLPDPVAGATAYAEQRTQPRLDRQTVDLEADLLVEAVWSEFLDRVVDAVRRQAQ